MSGRAFELSDERIMPVAGVCARGLPVLYDAAGRRGSRAARATKPHDEAGNPMVTNRLPPRYGDLIGRRVGGYLIEALLGEGGMGAVYYAVNHRIGQKAAIKVIASEFTQNPEIVGRFFREAKAVAAVDDPNIIVIYDCHEFGEDGLTYIIMKFVDGQSLDKLMASTGPMPIDAAVTIALQIASGLDAAHERGIVHCDIKPQNLLISRRWRRRFFLTIVDFGIAKLRDPYMAASFQTKAATVLGTLNYMAPEQARANREIVDARADVFSLGVVLYEMLTGRRPYNEDSVYGLVDKQKENSFPRPRELRPDIPQIIDETILWALQFKREKRLGTMREFGQRVAQGVKEGEQLLQVFASRLCVDGQAAPHEATLAGDVESAITRYAPAQSFATRARRGIFPVVAALAVGTAIGGVTMKLVSDRRAPATVAAAEPRSAPSDHAAMPAPTAVAVADAREPDAPFVVASAPDAQHELAVAPSDASSIDAGGTIAQAPPARPPSPPARPPAKPQVKPDPEPTKPARPATRAAADAAETKGVLVVRVQTWAVVSVDGVRIGTAPLRADVATGRHAVQIVKGTQNTTVNVNIGANAETVIDKNW
ncbi:MAG: serine/threonine-protein kinase [Kofleriaceae bacterium]